MASALVTKQTPELQVFYAFTEILLRPKVGPFGWIYPVLPVSLLLGRYFSREFS